MPFYDYECKKCHDASEVLQKTSDELLTVCEKCGGELKKIITNMNFHLHGPGFYTTDNKRKYLK